MQIKDLPRSPESKAIDVLHEILPKLISHREMIERGEPVNADIMMDSQWFEAVTVLLLGIYDVSRKLQS